MQCPVLPLQRHWGLRVLPSSHLVTPRRSLTPQPHLPLPLPPQILQVLLHLLYLLLILVAEQQQFFNFVRLSYPVISVMPPRPRQSFRKCLSVPSAPDSQTGQSTTSPWSGGLHLWQHCRERWGINSGGEGHENKAVICKVYDKNLKWTAGCHLWQIN